MVELRQAVAGGIKSLEDYRTDPNLDPLRGREDFRALLMDLAFPVRPVRALSEHFARRHRYCALYKVPVILAAMWHLQLAVARP